MKISALLRFLSCAFVATALSLTASAQTAAGQIKAAKVEGQVLKISASGASTAIKDGDVIAETDTISTGKASGIVLVFMNGSTVKLGAESRLAIDEFKMDPLEQEVAASTLKAEPTVSKTTLNLAYGEMVGDVKKLNKSSSYSIKTPVGAAGIRGTIYRIVFRPSADGKAFFTVSTAEGLVVVQGVASGDVPVAVDKEVVIEIDTNNPSSPKTITTQDMPAATKTLINDTVKVITDTLSTTTLSSSTTTTTPSGTTVTVAPPPPPDTTPPTPPTTPGAGQ